MLRRLYVALACLGLSLALPPTIAGAQGSRRWTVGQLMRSERTEIAAAEVNGGIYVGQLDSGERALEIYDPVPDR